MAKRRATRQSEGMGVLGSRRSPLVGLGNSEPRTTVAQQSHSTRERAQPREPNVGSRNARCQGHETWISASVERSASRSCVAVRSRSPARRAARSGRSRPEASAGLDRVDLVSRSVGQELVGGGEGGQLLQVAGGGEDEEQPASRGRLIAALVPPAAASGRPRPRRRHGRAVHEGQ
jgi:hypothetical protein